MGSRYYCADSENGEHIDDPSEDALFMLIDDLNDTDNTFVVVQPDEDAPAWFASVAVLDEGGYEIDLRDATRREHEVSTESDIGNIASDLIHWLAARNIPGRPTRQISSS
ncbi:hypothetical protein AMK26_13010 [Streptomyces sp. CB03234]|uniref:hypothetical protein n=1 Tax=Streptomyces sp. (strain CB03234) TaxID=1703937 RepID=UPI00093D4B09|nr:hypothetical protein [Streptomyces sp. CB03234]OKK04297.1 hypothetical protein AMK26_13010 [Streptomyces sp. CB03234]